MRTFGMPQFRCLVDRRSGIKFRVGQVYVGGANKCVNRVKGRGYGDHYVCYTASEDEQKSTNRHTLISLSRSLTHTHTHRELQYLVTLQLFKHLTTIKYLDILPHASFSFQLLLHTCTTGFFDIYFWTYITYIIYNIYITYIYITYITDSQRVSHC